MLSGGDEEGFAFVRERERKEPGLKRLTVSPVSSEADKPLSEETYWWSN